MTREDFQRRHGIIGESTEIKEITGVLMQVAPTNLTVLITGESGTGKEIVAHAIHDASPRAAAKFVAVNCGAIPETLLESELFGHEKGAYTGAHESRKGFFELADKGTIFLDEIGEMPVGTQVKLLRVLETGEYNPVGSAESRRANVRVVAATNKDLAEEMRRGAFRQDLFYRLRAVSIHLPPLRERREDIPLLFDAFARAVAEKHGIEFRGVTPEAMRRLQECRWTGNVRELKNLVETLLVLEKGGEVTETIVEKYLPEARAGAYLPVQFSARPPEQTEREILIRALIELRNEIGSLRDQLLRARAVAPAGNNDIMTLDEAEKKMIAAALARNRYDKRKTSRELGISRRTLDRKIVAYGIFASSAEE